MKDLDVSKIDFSELRDFAATAASRPSRRSVIVELGGQAVKVPPRKPTRPTPRQANGRPDVLQCGDPQRGQAMDELQQALCALGLGQEAVRLDAAEAFVVSVTPEQLRVITRLPLVGVIRPNRTHRATRGKTGS